MPVIVVGSIYFSLVETIGEGDALSSSCRKEPVSAPSAPPDEPATQLERELRDQGSALAQRAPAGADAAAAAARLLARADVHYLLVAARGTSDNAARYLQYALGAEARLAVGLAAPSLYADPETAPVLDGAAVMAISQSGQSPDIVAVLSAARAQRRPTIAITNDADSPLAREADVVVPLAVGAERSVAATKTYTASLHAVQQILEALRPSAERRTWLARLPALVDEVVDAQLQARSAFDPLNDAAQLTVTGRSLDYAAAHETALKIRELAGLVTEAFSPPDLLHGPIAAVAAPGWCWLVSTTPGNPDAAALREAMLARSVPTVVVSPDAALRAGARVAIALPSGPPTWAAAVLAVLPGQVAALRLAELRGVTIDEPHGLSKVTLTR
jgi:glucosamine--fructose-6-phosphate aminotransferase (isomerizing)